MALLDRRRRLAHLLPFVGNARPPGARAQPECVVLGVREGVTPSAKPPVRIFLGTEPAQYRAERVFLDRKSTRLNSSHLGISYAVFCLKKKKRRNDHTHI